MSLVWGKREVAETRQLAPLPHRRQHMKELLLREVSDLPPHGRQVLLTEFWRFEN
jgi:hypothetical protein